MKRFSLYVCIFTLLIAWTPCTLADFYWESQVTSSGMPGGQDKDEITKTYMKDGAMRTESSDGIMIMDMENGLIYQIDNVKKTYSELNLATMFSGDSEAQQFMANMMKSMAEDIKIEKMDETKKISGYKCTKYVVTIMGMQSEQWVTKDVKGYTELQKSSKKYLEKFKDNPMVKNMIGNPAFDKVDGFPIQTVSQMGNIKTMSTVTKIEKKSFGDKLLKPPAGYTKVEPDKDSPF
jgi:Domain of unknown function (DUF4412)